jgi:hypothetical protein
MIDQRTQTTEATKQIKIVKDDFGNDLIQIVEIAKITVKDLKPLNYHQTMAV